MSDFFKNLAGYLLRLSITLPAIVHNMTDFICVQSVKINQTIEKSTLQNLGPHILNKLTKNQETVKLEEDIVLKISLTSVHVLLSNPRWRRLEPDPIDLSHN